MSKKSYAEAGLEDVQAEAANIPVDATEPVEQEEDFQQVGGLEPIAFYYRLSAPKKQPKQPYKILEPGQTITGTYERSFTTGKFNNPTYVIRGEDGQLFALGSTGGLKRAFDKLAEGSKVKVTYQGMGTIKNGQWAGNESHNFIVFGSRLKG